MKRILYPLIPLAVILVLFLPDMNKTIAILGNHSTMARIIKNPVEGRFSNKIVKAVEEGNFYLFDNELYNNLKNDYLIYKYSSLGKQYTDSVKVSDALSMNMPVFYDARKENRIFPIYAYKDYSISKNFVDYELGGIEAEFRNSVLKAIIFLIALGIAVSIYQYQNNLYKEAKILALLNENEYYEYLIVKEEAYFNVKVDYLDKYIKNSSTVDQYLIKLEPKIKKSYSRREESVSNILLLIINKQIEQEQILYNVVNQENKILALSNFLQNIKIYRRS